MIVLLWQMPEYETDVVDEGGYTTHIEQPEMVDLSK
jgi:hypothetical protein